VGSLFILLCSAPIATGGVWVHRPGFHIEYTQRSAALVLAAWPGGTSAEGDLASKSVVCRRASRVERWQALSGKPYAEPGIVWAVVSSFGS